MDNNQKVLQKIESQEKTAKWLFRWRVNWLRRQEADALLQSSVFAHACKTPLCAMLCTLETALQKEQEDELIKHSLEAAKRLRQLISYLESEKNGVPEHVFSISEAVKGVVLIIRALHPEAEVSTAINPAIYLVGPQLYFQEAVQCIVMNAIESYRKGQTPKVMISAQVRARGIQLDIIDSGRGMSTMENTWLAFAAPLSKGVVAA